MDAGQQNLRTQKWVLTVAITLFLVKMAAYWLTRSVAILTDALESTVNVVAGVIGLYSLFVAAKPKDENHPYGHGKAEFLSAAIEGTLIIVAGLAIIYESIDAMIHPRAIDQLDNGIYLVTGTAAVNFIVGYITIRNGKKNNSLALIASGKHLQSDTYTTLGIAAGLALIWITGLTIFDSITAIIFSFVNVYTGYRILRSSLAGIMDEADKELLLKVLVILNANRRKHWIDLHNLRVIKYGGQLHIDCHLTVPWYLNVVEAHKEVEELGNLIKREFGDVIELFVHTDACVDFSCSICTDTDCTVRKKPFEKQIPWTLENVLRNKKHSL